MYIGKDYSDIGIRIVFFVKSYGYYLSTAEYINGFLNSCIVPLASDRLESEGRDAKIKKGGMR